MYNYTESTEINSAAADSNVQETCFDEQTLKRSITELILLAFLLMNGMFLFACMIYVAEYPDGQSAFTDIPGGFWWSIITLTGVGYGIIPESRVIHV